MRILYMIAHILYRNKKFDSATAYLSKIEEYVHEGDALTYKEFTPRVSQLRAAILVFQDRVEESIDILQQLLKDRRLALSPETRLVTLVNLGAYQFQAKEYKASHRTLRDIYHSDGWCEKYMGKE